VAGEVLRVVDVWKRFGGVQALRGVSLSVGEGERVAVIGPNGSGKTTLFNVITGFVKPDHGRVYVCGVDVTGEPPYRVAARGVARTFQLVKPFKGMTVLENVVAAALSRTGSVEEAEEEARRVLDMVGLSGKAGVRAELLNLPEKKRLELARALALRPRILLLDEVMAGLRPREIEFIVGLLKRLSREEGVAVVVVEHVLKAVSMVAERVVVLHHGLKIAEGAPEEVMRDERVREAYIGPMSLG